MCARTQSLLLALGLTSLLCTSITAPAFAQNATHHPPEPAVAAFPRSAPKPEARHANFILAVRREGVGKFLEKMQRKFDESQFGRHVIVGTPVSGNTLTQGEVFAHLEPMEDRVDLIFEMKGYAHSPFNTAAQGPARVFTMAQTSLQGAMRVAWDGHQLVATPAQANCQTHTTPLGVSVERRHLLRRGEGGLIDRMISNTASSRAAQLRSQAEAESSRLAESRIRQRMTQEVSAKLADFNKQIQEYYNEPLTRNGIWAPSRVTMVGDYFALALTQPDHDEMAAESPADLEGVPGDFAAAIHETAVSAFLRPLFSGRYFSDSDIANFQKTLRGEVSYDYRIGAHPRWSIVFDAEQPISARMENGGFKLTLRGQQATIDNEAIAIPWTVDVSYQVRPTRTTLSFLRQGDISFQWIGDTSGTNPARDRAEQLLKQKLAGFFLPTLYLEGLEMPHGDQSDKMHAMHIDQAEVKGKWLYLVSLPNVDIWKLKPEVIRAAFSKPGKNPLVAVWEKVRRNMEDAADRWEDGLTDRVVGLGMMLAR